MNTLTSAIAKLNEGMPFNSLNKEEIKAIEERDKKLWRSHEICRASIIRLKQEEAEEIMQAAREVFGVAI